MYERAAEEFRAVLVDSPRRLDVWVAFAEVLWRGGEFEDASAVCEAIIAESPHCLKAIIILAQLRRRDGETSSAQSLLALAHELDPAGVMAGRLT
jgi:predicted Zn-dependent protease